MGQKRLESLMHLGKTERLELAVRFGNHSHIKGLVDDDRESLERLAIRMGLRGTDIDIAIGELTSVLYERVCYGDYTLKGARSEWLLAWYTYTHLTFKGVCTRLKAYSRRHASLDSVDVDATTDKPLSGIERAAQTLEQQEQLRAFEGYLSLLSENERRVIEGSYRLQLSDSVLAEHMNMRVGNVQTLRSRALQKLRGWMQTDERLARKPGQSTTLQQWASSNRSGAAPDETNRTHDTGSAEAGA